LSAGIVLVGGGLYLTAHREPKAPAALPKGGEAGAPAYAPAAAFERGAVSNNSQ
jgi:hypothetical protein